MKTEIKKLAKSEVEIDFELTAEEFQAYIDKALANLKNHVKVDGFRKGHVPANIAEEKIGKEILTIYGGSVNPENIKEFLSQPNIHGALPGQASLDPETFVRLVSAAGEAVV